MAEEKNKRKKWPVAVGIAGIVVVAAAVTDTWGGVAGMALSQLVLTILNAASRIIILPFPSVWEAWP